MNENRQLWQQYYDKALSRKHSPRTALAASLNKSSSRSAVDCGCGTGSDIHYLDQIGYRVHGFDINPDSVHICQTRFANNSLIDISCNSFEDYDYPPCGLLIANASLYFSDPGHFPATWARISASIEPGGVFAGDFMGLNDSWVANSQHQINAMTESQILALFEQFEVVRFQEHDEPGTTALGRPKHWHTFSVVAIRQASA